MCRNTLNVSYDGRIFDCDFNQQLSIPIEQQQQQEEGTSGGCSNPSNAEATLVQSTRMQRFLKNI